MLFVPWIVALTVQLDIEDKEVQVPTSPPILFSEPFIIILFASILSIVPIKVPTRAPTVSFPVIVKFSSFMFFMVALE